MRLLLLLLLMCAPTYAASITGYVETNRRDVNIYLLDMTDGAEYSTQPNQLGQYGFYNLGDGHDFYLFIEYSEDECMAPSFYVLMRREKDVTANFLRCSPSLGV